LLNRMATSTPHADNGFLAYTLGLFLVSDYPLTHTRKTHMM
jgi:hypothetical protein